MKISSVQLPPIHEEPAKWSASSQEARIEGFINSDALANLHAARLERALRCAQPIQVQQQPAPVAQQPKPVVKAWKSVCHAASLVCAALILPSFACLAFGAIGLIVPAALFVASVVLNVLGGKPTTEIQVARDERAAQNAVYDPR